MGDSLRTVKAIAEHMTARGEQVMITGGGAAMRARIGDFPALVHLRFRASRVLRISLALPAEVDDTRRTVFALALVRLNRAGLGGGFVMTRANVVYLTQIPTDAEGGVPARPLERALALAIGTCREAWPELERIGRTGLVVT